MTTIEVRAGTVDDLDTLSEIDGDAAELFVAAGLDVDLPGEFSIAERNRWLRLLSAGLTLIAMDREGHPLGFAAGNVLDGQPYLEQLSVRRDSMRQGIGRSLLEATERRVRKMHASALWLTTYRHLSWNKPFYERVGYGVVPEAECGPQIRQTLAYERRFLPRPEERIAMRKVIR